MAKHTCELCGQINDVCHLFQLVNGENKSGLFCKNCRSQTSIAWDKVDANRDTKRKNSLPRTAAAIAQYANEQRTKLAKCKSSDQVVTVINTGLAKEAIDVVFDSMDMLGLPINVIRPPHNASVDQCLDVLRTVSIQIQEQGLIKPKRTGGRSKPKRMFRHGDKESREIEIANCLVKNPRATLADIQRETGISSSSVSRTTVWKNNMQKKKAQSNPLDSASNLGGAGSISKNRNEYSVAPRQKTTDESHFSAPNDLDEMEEQLACEHKDYFARGYQSDAGTDEDIEEYRKKRNR